MGSASISRIVEPNPHGLISSLVKLEEHENKKLIKPVVKGLVCYIFVGKSL